MRESRLATGADLAALRGRLRDRAGPAKPCLTVCGDTGCMACDSLGLAEALRTAAAERRLEDRIDIKVTGCLGFCNQAPVVAVMPEETLYCRVARDDAGEIVASAACGEPVERLLYTEPGTGRRLARAGDIPFYRGQQRLLLGALWHTDPREVTDYIRSGGYEALARVLSMDPEAVIGMVREAKLRGRGGAGFPTWFKWDAARRQPGPDKYILCNADEGDPGAFMDRSLLEGTPHAVLEGMLIAGFAVGAGQGIIYVRAEYPTAVAKLERAVAEARGLGLLGRDVLGSGFDFDIAISKGAGAFVCGEETALMAAAEGRVGEPRQKPPFPVTRGFKGKPTVVNNVETFANVPPIVRLGPAEYLGMGTEASGGTKIFCLVGKVNNTGLVEVAFGTPLRDVIFGIGGGIKDGKSFKAVQTGGPSGGCLPESMLDLPVDFETLAGAGSIMGSGGMIVMDESTCVVDIARYFLEFLQAESCGKCFSCREGVRRMLDIIGGIAGGTAAPQDLALLEELAQVVKDASMCGLGQTAANPVLSTLRHFRSEYLAHVEGRRCPAAVCRALVRYRVLEELCTGCRACVKECPGEAVAGEKGEPHTIDPARCVHCGLCVEVCKSGAIAKV